MRISSGIKDWACARIYLPAVAVSYPERPTVGARRPGWRNGRRGGLKIRYSNGCVGSNPAPGTSIS